MPFPIFPVIAALSAGGSLVPHAAGGLIVSGASGYVAGTYLSTAAITTLLASASAAGVAGLAAFSGALTTAVSSVSSAASTVIGSTGFFGTSIGASGIKGVLVSLGVIPTVPIALPVAIGGAAIAGAGYLIYRRKNRYKGLVEKVVSTPTGEEAEFTEAEAKQVEQIILLLAKKGE
jgi:hypothetical protein